MGQTDGRIAASLNVPRRRGHNKKLSVRPSVCLSRRSTAAAADGGFAAAVGRGPAAADIDR